MFLLRVLTIVHVCILYEYFFEFLQTSSRFFHIAIDE